MILTRLDGEWRLVEVSLTAEELERATTRKHKPEMRGLLVDRGAQVLSDIVRRAREGQ